MDGQLVGITLTGEIKARVTRLNASLIIGRAALVVGRASQLPCVATPKSHVDGQISNFFVQTTSTSLVDSKQSQANPGRTVAREQ